MRSKILIAALVAFVALVPIVAPLLGQAALPSVVCRIMIYAIAAASLNVSLGSGGMISLGHAAFYGVGGYAVGLLYFHHADGTMLLGFIPGSDQFLVTLPIALAVSGIVALVIGALALRTGGVQFIMITLAFAQMLFSFFVSLNGYGGDDGIIVRGSNTLLGLSLKDKTAIFYVVLVIAVLFFWGLSRLKASSFGKILEGIRQNERRMTSIGIEPYKYKLIAFVISGVGAGLAGALMTIFLRFASPDSLAWTKSGELLIMLILGGVGSLVGPIWGATAFIFLQTYLSSWTEHWQIFLGAILLAVVMGTKGGIAGLVTRLGGRDA